MRRRFALITLGALLSTLTAFAQSAPPVVVAADTEIRKILAERVDTYHQSAQITGQPSVEVLASGPRDFFYKVVDARLTFEVGPDGLATAVILHQLGRDQRAARGN